MMRCIFFLLVILLPISRAESYRGTHLQAAVHCSRRTKPSDAPDLREIYLWTLKNSLTGMLLQTPSYQAYVSAMNTADMPFYNESVRSVGRDWPLYGLTMVGIKRLDNLQNLITNILANNVAGDFVECGVWRGGSSIFMRGVLKAYNSLDRVIHLVDSFDGLPPASTPEDEDIWSQVNFLKVPQDTVEDGFSRYHLLDNQVQFHKGFFRHSLPKFRRNFGDRKIALLRMDGDMYESTMDILFNLADVLAPGACIVVDDWVIEACQKAMKEFFNMHKMRPEIIPIDNDAVYFCLDESIDLKMAWYEQFNKKRSP